MAPIDVLTRGVNIASADGPLIVGCHCMLPSHPKMSVGRPSSHQLDQLLQKSKAHIAGSCGHVLMTITSSLAKQNHQQTILLHNFFFFFSLPMGV